MPRLEVLKTIEARKLNKRNRQMLAEPAVTIPYGALLDDIVENRDNLEFQYLGDLYTCRAEILRASSHTLGGPSAGSSGTASAPAVAPEPESQPTFVWEKLRAKGEPMMRAKLPGGWLIAMGDGPSRSIVFYPDPSHSWTGETL